VYTVQVSLQQVFNMAKMKLSQGVLGCIIDVG
jgi:hypothetical protein